PGRSESLDAFLLSRRLLQSFTQNDPDILSGMVIVNVGIAVGATREIEEPVLCEQGQHVIEKGNGRVDPPSAGPVQGQGDLDLALGRVALHNRLPLTARVQRPRCAPGCRVMTTGRGAS